MFINISLLTCLLTVQKLMLTNTIYWFF